jgi:hypothetical protein
MPHCFRVAELIFRKHNRNAPVMKIFKGSGPQVLRVFFLVKRL